MLQSTLPSDECRTIEDGTELRTKEMARYGLTATFALTALYLRYHKCFMDCNESYVESRHVLSNCLRLGCARSKCRAREQVGQEFEAAICQSVSHFVNFTRVFMSYWLLLLTLLIMKQEGDHLWHLLTPFLG